MGLVSLPNCTNNKVESPSIIFLEPCETISNSCNSQFNQTTNFTKTKIKLFLYFYQTYGVQQYMLKASQGLGFMIQFKVKTPNNILLITYLAFIPFVTSRNVLPTNVNLNNKNPTSNNFYYKFALITNIFIL